MTYGTFDWQLIVRPAGAIIYSFSVPYSYESVVLQYGTGQLYE